MEKKEIVKIFMENGVLLQPKELENINESNYLKMLETHKNKSEHSIKKQPETNIEKEDTAIIFDIKPFNKKTKMEPKDFINYYNKKYSGIRDLLIRKLNAVSINKAKELTSTSNIIGMIKERTQNGFIMEDQTGSLEIITNNDLLIGDVICIIGTSREGKFLVKEVVYPDIPLTHKPNIVDTEISLLKNKDDWSISINSTTKSVVVPAKIKIKRNSSEIVILVFKPEKPIMQDVAVEFLKKRHLSPSRNEIKYDEDIFIIDPIPDILWLVGEEEYVKNYKGVTIVSTGNRSANIDLSTKKVEFMN
ncbi:MAG: hypothetical protein ABIF08_03495 [Nanoarchaeota archaeon]